MLPFSNFSTPTETGYTERCYDKGFMHFKAVKHQVVNGCQSNNGLAASAIQQQSRCRMIDYEVHAVFLIVMQISL